MQRRRGELFVNIYHPPFALGHPPTPGQLSCNKFHNILLCISFQLIQQELSIDGLLDINIPITTSNQNTTSLTNTQQATTTTTAVGTLGVPQSQSTANSSHTRVPYSQTSVTPPSWVH